MNAAIALSRSTRLARHLWTSERRSMRLTHGHSTTAASTARGRSATRSLENSRHSASVTEANTGERRERAPRRVRPNTVTATPVSPRPGSHRSPHHSTASAASPRASVAEQPGTLRNGDGQAGTGLESVRTLSPISLTSALSLNTQASRQNRPTPKAAAIDERAADAVCDRMRSGRSLCSCQGEPRF
jgi:hypothetical protein